MRDAPTLPPRGFAAALALLWVELGLRGSARLWRLRYRSQARPEAMAVYVLGESTAFGEPFAPKISFARIVSLRFGGRLRGRPLPPKLVVFGEVGLAGEIRPVQRGQERLREAAKLGFEHALVPRGNITRQGVEGIEAIPVDRIEQAVAWLREH